MATSSIASSSHTIRFNGSIPRGEKITHGRPIVDRATTEEVHCLNTAGIYGPRGEAVSDALRRLIATA